MMVVQDCRDWLGADEHGISGRDPTAGVSQKFSEPKFNEKLFRYCIHNDFRTCEAEWRQFESEALVQPFQSIKWLKTWWEAYRESVPSPDLSPRIVFAYQGDQLKFILPLALERRWGMGCLTWLGHHLIDYNAPIIDRELLTALNDHHVARIWRDVMSEITGVDCLYLPKQPASMEGQTNPFYGFSSYDYGLGYHAAEINADWQSYYRKRRGAKSRRRLRDKAKALADLGTLCLKELTGPEDRSRIILQTLKWKREQVASTGAIDPFSVPETERFFDQLARNPEMAGKLRVFTIDLDGESLASAFGLMDGKNFILYQTAYGLGRYSKFSPGTHLLIHMMECMAAAGVRHFDFSIGDEAYKFEWADTHAKLSASIAANSLSGWFAKQTHIAKLALKRWVKSSDTRFRRVKAMRRAVMRLTA